MLKVYGLGLSNAKNVNMSQGVQKQNNSANIYAGNASEKDTIMNQLNSMACVSRVSFTGENPKMEIGLSTEELKKRTGKAYLATKKMLTTDAPEYANLATGDKEALKHLVKASYILEEAYLKMDDSRNIPFRDYLKSEIKKGNEDAKLTMKLFKAQKGINAIDNNAVKFSLLKGGKGRPGNGIYPADLKVEEFHSILKNMLKEGKTDEVKAILNQRSVVERDGKELKAVDYTQAYKKEFTAAANELEKAAKTSTNKDFNEYLMLQSKALKENSPMADAYADKKWATLQDTPLEFSITRENYTDEITGTVVEDKELAKMLSDAKISAVPKDMLGMRVGIINKEGTERLLQIKKYLPALAKEMPFSDKYKQNISADAKAESKQTMVDVDIVALKGDVGAYRAGVTLAENLPNDDKLSFSIGGGRRNVYHRQIRAISDHKKLQKTLDAILDKDLHKYYENEADHWFTIGHENAHSLGPSEGTEALGKYRSIIEENKADMTSLSMLDKLEELGMYTAKQKKQIITTFVADNFLKAKPKLTQAHRVRTVMQMNHLINEGAVDVDKAGIIHINYDKFIPASKKMLEEIISVQMSKDFSKGEKYVKDNFVWTDKLELIATKLRKLNKTLNGQLEEKLAKALLRA
ncbi:hypothetical protein KBA27_04915 [bacterium]|nr:hypothetical protein [bacterium]